MARVHAVSISPAWNKDDITAHLQTDLCFGIDDPLSGFIIVRTAADQAEILTIVVSPNNRGSGFGHALLRAAESALRTKNIDIIFLEVAEDNMTAIKLYKHFGFEQFGRRPAYYRREGGRVAALTFRKRLDG